jgi:hypothetical protein
VNPFELAVSEAGRSFIDLNVGVTLPRMLAAAGIGTALATRPWRFLIKRPLPPAEMIQAQILLCAAAAVITAVIGDSLAKAFGLVGLGSFVRFRSGLKDPRDAAILFLVIGLGMACGHGALGLAFVGMLFVASLLAILDLVGGGKDSEEHVTVHAHTTDPAGVESALRKAFMARNVIIRSAAMDLQTQQLQFVLAGANAAKVAKVLTGANDAALKDLRWTLSSGKDPEGSAGREDVT